MNVGVNCLFMIPGEVGGSETYLRSTLQALAADAPDVQWVLFTNQENDAVLRDLLAAHANVRTDCLGFAASDRYHRILREQTQLPWRVKRAGVDVLWSPGYTAPLCSFCPQVVSILDMQYKSHPDDLSRSARVATDILVRASARAARILAISEFSKGEIVRFTGADPSRIRVTPLAVDPRFGRRADSAAHSEMVGKLLGHEHPFLLVVANTYPHKRVDLAVEAFARLQQTLPHDLVLIGQPRRGEAAVQLALHKIQDVSRVHRLFRVREEEVAALFQAASVFVFPSVYEGFGLPVLESLMAGTPVVTTRCGSLPEVGGDCVSYVAAGRADLLARRIEEILAWTPAQLDAHVRAAVAHARTYTWSRTAARTMDVFREVVGT